MSKRFHRKNFILFHINQVTKSQSRATILQSENLAGIATQYGL